LLPFADFLYHLTDSTRNFHCIYNKVKVKWFRYRPGVAQSIGRGIALLFHDRGTRRGWVVSSTPRPHFTHGKEPVPILQEAGWAPGPVWTGGKSRPHRDSISDRPAVVIRYTDWVTRPTVSIIQGVIFIHFHSFWALLYFLSLIHLSALILLIYVRWRL